MRKNLINGEEIKANDYHVKVNSINKKGDELIDEMIDKKFYFQNQYYINRVNY